MVAVTSLLPMYGKSDIREKIHWRRYTYPDAPHESPDGGEWVELSERRRYNGAELLAQAQQSPNLLVSSEG